MYPMTPWVKRLVIANVAVFVAFAAGLLPGVLYGELAFVPFRPGVVDGVRVYLPDLLYRPWTLVTYAFLHAGIWHIGFNMLILWFFGPRLEERVGSGHFIWLYLLSGLGGAVLSYLTPGASIVGASGAVYGVTAGFARYWPRERIYIWGVLPIEAWQLLVVAVVFSTVFGFGSAMGGTAHFAHLGGIVVGYLYVRAIEWRRGSAKREFQRKLDPGTGGSFDRGSLRRWEAIRLDQLHEINRSEVAELLEKARADGVRSLSASERQFMDRMAASSGG